MLNSKTLVSEMLEILPEPSRLWIKLHTDCIGCSMNRFCLLEDMCMAYKLDLNQILSLIHSMRVETPKFNSG